MLEYERIDVSEGIDVNKSRDKLRECGLCHFWYFLDKKFSLSKVLLQQLSRYVNEGSKY